MSTGRSKKIIKIAVSITIVGIGIGILGFLANRMNAPSPESWVLIVFNIGLSLLVTGMMAFTSELFFGEPEAAESDSGGGFKMMPQEQEREGFSGYNKWALDKRPKTTVKFMGHAVLKSMDGGLPKKNNIVDVFIDQMKIGVNIRVLFYDPQYDIVERVSTDIANEDSSVLYDKLNSSLDIAKELHDKLKVRRDEITGSICIKMAKEPILYAYHYVKDECEEYAYIGFYFSEKLGYKTPPFIVDDHEILKHFDTNFDEIFTKATPLFNCSRRSFSLSGDFKRKKAFIEGKLGRTSKSHP